MKTQKKYLLWIVPLLIGCSTPKNETSETSLPTSQRFEADWKSLDGYHTPKWFQDAKFGIFIHWGPYSVPAFGSEWYPRLMYMDTATFSAQLNPKSNGPNEVYQHHMKTWGNPQEFGYKDFIPLFKGENFDPVDWIQLFKDAGARYVVPVAEHHDGFAMYDSKHTRWRSTNMGPKRDVLGALFEEGRKQGLKMGASSHFAFNWAFYNKKPHFDTMDPAYSDLYSEKGTAVDEPVSEAFKALWWNRTTQLITDYKPDVLYFDFFWDNEQFKAYHPKLAAFYYNKGLDWDKEVVLQNKNLHYESFPGGTFVHDLERGKMADIRKEPWQTDTSIGSNSWGYIKEWKSKDVNKIVDDLVDIVSKNGCLLLNVGPKANGTIPQDQRDFLLEIGKWLAINGEAIYGSRHWKTFGEGPTKVEEGYMSEKKEDGLFTSEDIRFTTKGDQLYAIALDWPENGKLTIKTLRSGADESVAIKNITLLGSAEPLQWNQNEEALHIQLPDEKTGKYAHVLAINR